MIRHEDQPQFEEGRGAGVTAADFAELVRRRDEQARIDLPLLGPVVHHATTRVTCEWCGGKVARFATTPDGARHYDRGCISKAARYLGVELPRTEQ